MKILIAEDDPISAMALEIVLKKQGHVVTTVADGRAAWQKFQEGDYPIVITDWMMPEMNGLELCQKIREYKRDSYTCIIMLTAKDGKQDRKLALKTGIDVFLTKPISASDMIARIRVACRILEIEEAA